MAFSAVYDACVLFPFETRDVLMISAATRCFALYWTDEILDECTRNLIERGKATRDNMKRMVADMKALYPYATIPPTDYIDLVPAMTNHPKDRHVLAAAVACKADVIVTVNFKDFPPAVLRPYSIEAEHPDDFVRHVLDLDAEGFVKQFKIRNNARRSFAINNNKPPHSDEAVAAHLAKSDPPMPKTSKFLLEWLAR